MADTERFINEPFSFKAAFPSAPGERASPGQHVECFERDANSPSALVANGSLPSDPPALHNGHCNCTEKAEAGGLEEGRVAQMLPDGGRASFADSREGGHDLECNSASPRRQASLSGAGNEAPYSPSQLDNGHSAESECRGRRAYPSEAGAHVSPSSKKGGKNADRQSPIRLECAAADSPGSTVSSRPRIHIVTSDTNMELQSPIRNEASGDDFSLGSLPSKGEASGQSGPAQPGAALLQSQADQPVRVAEPGRHGSVELQEQTSVSPAQPKASGASSEPEGGDGVGVAPEQSIVAPLQSESNLDHSGTRCHTPQSDLDPTLQEMSSLDRGSRHGNGRGDSADGVEVSSLDRGSRHGNGRHDDGRHDDTDNVEVSSLDQGSRHGNGGDGAASPLVHPKSGLPVLAPLSPTRHALTLDDPADMGGQYEFLRRTLSHSRTRYSTRRRPPRGGGPHLPAERISAESAAPASPIRGRHTEGVHSRSTLPGRGVGGAGEEGGERLTRETIGQLRDLLGAGGDGGGAGEDGDRSSGVRGEGGERVRECVSLSIHVRESVSKRHGMSESMSLSILV